MPASSAVNNGPALSLNEFENLFDSIKSWNEYSSSTLERGALNHITQDKYFKQLRALEGALAG